MVPAMNWPCPPMFHTPARKAIAAASPVRISGVACTSVSRADSRLPKAPSYSDENASIGETPANSTSRPITTAVRASAISVAYSSCTGRVSRRRSSRQLSG